MSKNEPTARNSTEVDTTRSDVDAFLAEMTKASASGISGTGRLIFALDATNSRHETWDMACQLQGDMFRTVATVGGPAGLLPRPVRVPQFTLGHGS
jgi:hypothetical protein